MAALGWVLNLGFGASTVVVPGGLYNAVGYFATGSNVTITIYDPVTSVTIGTDDANCTEIGTTGVFVWSMDNLTTTPLTYQEYAWKMNDGASAYQAGKVAWSAPVTTSRLNAITYR